MTRLPENRQTAVGIASLCNNMWYPITGTYDGMQTDALLNSTREDKELSNTNSGSQNYTNSQSSCHGFAACVETCFHMAAAATKAHGAILSGEKDRFVLSDAAAPIIDAVTVAAGIGT